MTLVVTMPSSTVTTPSSSAKKSKSRHTSVLSSFGASFSFQNRVAFFKDNPDEGQSRCKQCLLRALEYWPEFVVFILAIIAAVVSFILLRNAENSAADKTFISQASDRGTVLVWEMSRVLGDLQIVTSFMSISPEWRDELFRERFKNLTAGILSRSPGTQGLTWVPMVWDTKERLSLEEQQGRQLGLMGERTQLRISNDTGKSIRCVYLKNATGANLCSPTVPMGGPFQAAGAGRPHAFFPVSLPN